MHGWKYAYSKKNTKLESALHVSKKLGLCADWFSGSKAENAWLSANSLYQKIKKNPRKIRGFNF